MFWRKKRPTFVKGNVLTNATFENNTVSGNADFLDVKRADNLKMSENKHITPTVMNTPWYKTYARELSVTVIAGLIVALITIFYLEPWGKNNPQPPQVKTKTAPTK
jgi:hypothetical protein